MTNVVFWKIEVFRRNDFLQRRCGFYVLSEIESDIFRGFVGSMSKVTVFFETLDFVF